METPPFDNKHSHTLESIFQNPVPSDLKWHDIIGLVEAIGTVKFKNNGQLTFTVNGVPRIFHRALDKDCADPPQTLALRHFLESVGIGQNSALASQNTSRLLVVISQHEARIFHSDEKGSVPQRLHPPHPEARESTAFYATIAPLLVGAKEILLLGSGTGHSSAMGHFMDYLETHHKETATHLVGALTVDLEALTEGQLLKEAREFYRNREPLSTRDHQGVEVG
ncbi:hypothetical protein [Armatimonas rosea]|uniref:Uncharacterized protein n=1 Tax=Armatimonas rosea TaxID=685828 RepID=A0A7W9W7N4_ARMRO|nr:hypothetical protein [Armatimonas rosea]MBB6050792.1 hypothetical protein [Armatimonas rosea]